jgi:hypothetical protein
VRDLGRLVRAELAGAMLLFLASLSIGCNGSRVSISASPESADPLWFEDVTASVGLHFQHDPGPIDDTYFLPQIMGSGAAFFDFDNDGRLDIYLLQNGGPNSTSTNRLFRQGPDGRFTDVSAGSGLDVAGYGMGVAIADVNNDGWPDVLVTEYGRLRLFLNNGNGTFTDISKEAGLSSTLWGTSASFVDYDRDGWLDLVVVNYVDYDPLKPCADGGGRRKYCPPARYGYSVTKLYRNLGPLRGDKRKIVAFEDVTAKSGLGHVPGPGLGVVCADFDGDGWPDIFVANDAEANRLWLNQHDGTFKEDALVRGIAFNCTNAKQANMGIALGDVDGSGRFAVFVTHLTEETNTLWMQNPRGMFQDRTGVAKLATPRWRGTGFGTLFGDFDHDGALDLAVVNGRVSRGPPGGNNALNAYWNDYAERNQLFVNDSTGKFRDVSPSNDPFCGTAWISRGLTCGDINGDGALDLLVTTVGGPALLYRNCAPKRGHWLMVRAIDPALHRDAYGATITVETPERQWVGGIYPGQSYLCSLEPRAHFGLGQAAHIDGIRVVWPDGSAEAFPGCAADQSIQLRKGEGRILSKQGTGNLTVKP